ncbi:hypothetical protein [Bradyrhizobium sp. NAS80.1]|nr:hypothetical protein [Bradyrhizobium sp. NAS80.1]
MVDRVWLHVKTTACTVEKAAHSSARQFVAELIFTIDRAMDQFAGLNLR